MEAEQEVSRKSEQLRKLNAEKDKLFSIIAHDLRSPFNSLMGLTDLLVEELPSMSRQETVQLAASLKRSSERLYRLVQNLLDWALLQQGLTKFTPERILVCSEIDANIDYVQPTALKKNIRIGLTVPDDLAILADKGMFDSLMRNLLFNAIKFTPSGGEINIGTTPVCEGMIEFSVQDTGVGMNKETVGKLFQLGDVQSRIGTGGETGSGLGLQLCREYVTRHGGSICVESEIGKGSVFRFTLPSA